MTMKVLYITPNGVGDTSPQIAMANFIRPRFDRLDLLVTGKDSVHDFEQDWDVVFGAMEASVPIAFQIATKKKIPLYSHWEWLPPFRLFGYPGGDDPRNWGYRDEHLDSHYLNNGYYHMYKQIIECAINSNINSCAGIICRDIANEFSGDKLKNCFIKYPSSPMPRDKNRDREKEDCFITISRLVPNKRVVDLALVVREANLETTWVIVGSGPEQKLIEKILEKSKTKLKFYANTNGEEKFSLLSKAKFQLSAWHGLPQLEAALVGTPTINLDIPYIRELYGNSLTWATSIKDMSEKINLFFNDRKMCKEKADRLYEAAFSNKLNINTLEQGANIIEETLRRL